MVPAPLYYRHLETSCQDQDPPAGRNILYGNPTPLSQDGGKTDMVDVLGTTVQWSSASDREVGPDNMLGCLQDGLGCILQWPEHWRTMDPSGVCSPHQPPGAQGCLLWPEVDLSDLAVETWKWCIRRNIFIYAEHLPGKQNVEVNWESRHVHDSSDWKLNRQIFLELESISAHSQSISLLREPTLNWNHIAVGDQTDSPQQWTPF